MINSQPTSSTVISNMKQKYLNQEKLNSPRSDEHRHHWIRYIIIVMGYCKNSDLLFQHIISPIISKRSKVFWYVFAIYHAIMPETKLTKSNSVKLGTGIILQWTQAILLIQSRLTTNGEKYRDSKTNPIDNLYITYIYI